jgi:peptidoglycan/LPS O-acetylase OafA/YrhL
MGYYKEKKYFDLFDLNVLKGIAILGVLIIHTDQMMSGLNRWVDMLSEAGQMGCQIFFVLSGFGLCYSWQKIKGNAVHRYGTFLKSRWRKIGFPYLLTIGLLLIYLGLISVVKVDSVIKQPVEILGVGSLLFFVNGLIPKYQNYLLIGSWYIGTLALLYVIFPIVYGFARRSSDRLLKISGWMIMAFPIALSLIDYYFSGGG